MKKIILVAFILLLTTAERLFAQNDIAAHNYLKSKTGSWSVTMTLWPAANAAPIVIKNLTAERTMVGDYCLHEVMHPAPGANMNDFQRLCDLAYNVNEQRWDYMSIDTRITAGIMYFIYSGSDDSTISSFITSFPHPGFGPDLQGRGKALYARNVVVKMDGSHDIVRQYWRLTDQAEWLAIQYEYSRK
jgi:hypothetical protein